MKLYFIRHGAAEPLDEGRLDSYRSLTPQGRHQIAESARALRAARERPRVILTSPHVRAVQTAEVLALLLDPEHSVVVRPELAPGGKVLDLVQELFAQEARPTMLVGHAAELSEALTKLLVYRAWCQSLEKGMVVGVRMDRAGEARLRFVLDPRCAEMHASPGWGDQATSSTDIL